MQKDTVLQNLAKERESLAATARQYDTGRAFSRAWTLAIDRAVQALVPDGHAVGWAVVAVGGYGRGDLSPHSDVDLLVVCSRHSPVVERLASALFYALWDAGLHLLPGVRTPAEARRLAGKDLASFTAGLETRLLAGDAALHAELAHTLLAEARKGGARDFLRALAAENGRRHARAAEAAYGLEPDLKEGFGGLRDAHALRWAGMALLEAAEPAAQARAGYLDDDEAVAIEGAVDFLVRARNHLHLLAGRKNDRLAYEYQPEIAAYLAYPPANGHLPAERLMRDLHAHAGALSSAAAGFWEHVEERLLAKPSPVAPVIRVASAALGREGNRESFVRGGRLHLAAGVPSPRVPADALNLFATAARQGARLSHALARGLRQHFLAPLPPSRWSDGERKAMFAVLRAGDLSEELLEQMADCGLLAYYLPEWEAVRYLTRQDPLHRHTVDRHSAAVVALLTRLAAGRGHDGEFGAAVAAEVASFDLLLLAGLLHDLGKGSEGDHSLTGAEMAQAIAGRMGLEPAEAETLAFLVREHLLLARTASRRDLDDPDLIVRLAGTAENGDRLRMLFLLTVADGLATGPGVWTDWKATLVRELFLRVSSAMNGNGELQTEARLPVRKAALREALAGVADSTAIEDFLARMPETYLLSQSVEAARLHLPLMAAAGSGAPRISIRRSPDGVHDELTLAAADRPGLLWRVCGVFALHGIDIHEARVYTDARGAALDVFRLSDAFESEITAEKRAVLARDIVLALEGRLALGYRLARKLHHYAQTGPRPSRPPRVSLDNAASTEYTVVDVRAPDRLGLLYSLTRALSDLHLDIHLAKVSTQGPEAVDAFYVRDFHGRKIDDPEHAREVEKALEFAVTEGSPGGFDGELGA